MKKFYSVAMALIMFCSTSSLVAKAEDADSAENKIVFDENLDSSWVTSQTSDFIFFDIALEDNSGTQGPVNLYANVGGVWTDIGAAYCDYYDNLFTDKVRGGFQSDFDHYCYAHSSGIYTTLSPTTGMGICSYTEKIDYYSNNYVTVKGFSNVG